MASNTSYPGVYRVASALSCFFRASFVICKHLAVLVPDLGCKGAPCFVSISRSNLLWLVFVHRRFSLISACLDPSNGLNIPTVRLMLCINLKRDCSGNRLSVGF
jgi:hypothetical protein